MRMNGWSRLMALGLAMFLMGAGRLDIPPLVEAAKNADRAAVQALLAEGADVNVAHGDGTTALHWASHWNDLEIADLLIRAGADVNATNDLGVTPLWPATVNGSPAMVRRLLAAGANPNAALLLGETLVMTASWSGNAEVVELLLKAGADPNSKPLREETVPCAFDPVQTCSPQAGGQTALMWAVANQHPEAVAALLAHGADVHARSHVYSVLASTGPPHPIPENQRNFPHGGDTAMMFAARTGSLESAKLLVAAGANVNDADAWGISAVSMAAYWNHGELVEYLLEQGADPNLASSEISALHGAILNLNEEMVTALLAHGADPNAPLRAWTHNERGSRSRWINLASVGASPLWLAARFGTPNMMRQLVEAGAHPHFVHYAAYYSPRIGSVRGSDVGLDAPRLTESTTILMAALEMGGPGGGRFPTRPARQAQALALEAAKLAVEWGVDLNAINVFNRTCEVPWEVPAGQVRECVEVETPDQEYYGRFAPPRTALEGAIALEYDSVAEFLRGMGARTFEEMGTAGSPSPPTADPVAAPAVSTVRSTPY